MTIGLRPEPPQNLTPKARHIERVSNDDPNQWPNCSLNSLAKDDYLRWIYLAGQVPSAKALGPKLLRKMLSKLLRKLLSKRNHPQIVEAALYLSGRSKV